MDYKKQKKIIANSSKKFCNWVFYGSKNPDKLKVAKDFSAWVLGGSDAANDILLVDTPKIKIEDVKKVQSFMSTTAAVADQKIAILNNFENITKNAANALLKVLEDPRQNAKIIIVTDNLHQILNTIRSRCFLLYFPPRYCQMKYLNQKLIKEYKSALLYMSQESDFCCEQEDLKSLVLFVFARILKFLHKVTTQELFCGEFEILKTLKSSKIFWHYRYKQAADLITRGINLDFRYAINFLFSQ